MTRNIRLLLLCAAGLVFVGAVLLLVSGSQPLPSYQQEEISVGDIIVTADIADTPALQKRGLSGRATLQKDRGMLFVFPEPGRYGFWMRDMNFPIDIVWIGEDFTVIGIEEQVPPDSYPHVFYPTQDVLSVLELPAGFAAEHNLTRGTAVALPSL